MKKGRACRLEEVAKKKVHLLPHTLLVSWQLFFCCRSAGGEVTQGDRKTLGARTVFSQVKSSSRKVGHGRVKEDSETQAGAVGDADCSCQTVTARNKPSKLQASRDTELGCPLLQPTSHHCRDGPIEEEVVAS